MKLLRTPTSWVGRIGIVLAAVAVVFAGGLGVGIGMGLSSAGAQVGGEINGCVNNYTGQLRILRGGQKCSAGEVPISWNQQGPSGLLDIQKVQSTETVETPDAVDSVSVSVECPDGYRVIGGGAGPTVKIGADIWAMDSSNPVEAGQGVFVNDGWIAFFVTTNGADADGTYSFQAEAICVLTS